MGISHVATNGQWLLVNQKFCDIVGYTCEELLERTFQEITYPEDLDTDLENVRQMLAGQIQKYSMEKRYIRKDGSLIWINLTVSLVREPSGEPKYFIAVIEDISERKRAESALNFLAEASNVLADSLDYEVTLARLAQLAVPTLADLCIIDMVETDGSIRRLASTHNDPIKDSLMRDRLYSYPPKPDTPHPVLKVIRTNQPELMPEIDEALIVAIAHNEEHLQTLRELSFKSSIVVPLVARGRTLGAISLIVTSSERSYGSADLTLAESLASRAALAVDNARTHHEAQEANRLKDEFLAIVSHELRTPLNAMLGWSQMLKSRKLDAVTTARAIETIERNAKLQTTLIEDLLDVSRIIQGKLNLQVRPVRLVPVIEAAIEAVKPAAQAKNIQLQTILDPLDQLILGDSNRLQQIVWNLVSNAIKFTPSGGRVEVRLSHVDNFAQIQVSDTGNGISPEFMPYVFERFHQQNSTSTRSQGGLGLGLAIVRHLVELHGGTVLGESAGEGKGATFTVQLPLLEGTKGVKDNQEQYSLPNSLTTLPLQDLRILVVDDDQDSRQVLTTVLQQWGAEVTAVASVRKALEALEQWCPQVLVSDIGMPEADGYALIRQVRNWQADIQKQRLPAIAVTAYARDEDREQAIAAGFQRHLSKPIEPVELVRVIANLAGRIT